MKIRKIVIKNFKIYQDLNLEINQLNNILVGDNGSGKTTLLEAIYMALNGKLNSLPIDKEITPSLFNAESRRRYQESVQADKHPVPPELLIEIYFEDEDLFAAYKGKNNSLNEDLPGIRLLAKFDPDFTEEYKSRLIEAGSLNGIPIVDIPTEYYSVSRRYFQSDPVQQRKNPFRAFYIDGTRKSYANYVGRYVYANLGETMSDDETSKIRTVYESIRQQLKDHEVIRNFNDANKDTLKLAGRKVELSVKDSLPDDWLQEITVNVDSFPYDSIGFGLQKMIELELAVGQSSSSRDGILLFEEPENNLSYSNMSKLVNVLEAGNQRQKFVSTHSSFVANKLGLNNILLCQSGNIEALTQLPNDDFAYFQKLPGYNTLRVLLGSKVILVEGPTDELIVNRAYRDQYGKLPIEDGIDVIVVDSLAFKRYLSLATLIQKSISVITDNDGNMDALKNKYEDYMQANSIVKFYVEQNTELNTLEPSMIRANVEKGSLETLNAVVHGKIGEKDDSADEIVNADTLGTYMKNHKTEWGLRVFNSVEQVAFPKNITEAIEHEHNK
ncbi:ATP-dependent nuclease [Liquorilactobacillus sp.]|uniref:ATP-dependent nuclease n=1 Tax=Liquorilactobacillus sp. TaxID=2767923 RepID=UPI0039EC939C